MPASNATLHPCDTPAISRYSPAGSASRGPPRSRARRASMSTSQSGNRSSTSSRATRPSSRASAAPRQKWMPYPNAMVVVDRPVDVEDVAVGWKGAMVAVGRAAQEHHRAALRHRLAVELDVAGDVAARAGCAGGSKRRISSIAFGISDRSSSSSRRWSGCSPRTLPVQPISRFVVSLPAEARMLTKIRISSRVRCRTVPVSSSNSTWSSSRHEVVGRVRRAPVDVVGEERLVGEVRSPYFVRLAGLVGASASSSCARGRPPGPPRGCPAASR